MGLFKKVVSGMLAVSMMITLIMQQDFSVTATDAPVEEMIVSKSSDSFLSSGTSMNNIEKGWSYDHVVGNIYTPYNTLQSSGWWCNNNQLWGASGGAKAGQISPATSADAAFSYTMPKDGVITLSADIFDLSAPYEGSPADGVKIAVFKNDVKVFPIGKEWLLKKYNDSVPFTPISISGKSGDKIHFRVNCVENTADDVIQFDPIVTYTSYVYDAIKDPEAGTPPVEEMLISKSSDSFLSSGTSMNNIEKGWSYDHVVGNIYTPYNTLQSSGWWCNNNQLWGASGGAKAGQIAPSASADAAFSYTMPKDGDITLSTALFESKKPADGYPSDGVKIAVFKNGVKIFPAGNDWLIKTYGDSTVWSPINISGRKGDTINFRVNCNMNNVEDVMYFDPMVTYTSYEYHAENDPAPDQITPVIRGSRPAGMNLPEDKFPMVARTFSGESTSMTAEAIIAGLTQKTLLAGTYKVEGALNFTGLTDVILDGSNIKLELDKTITFENCNNVTLKNISIFTSNNATPVIDIKSSCKNINFTKIEFTSSDVLNGSMATIMKAAALVIVNGCRFDSGNSYNGILLEEGAKGSTIKNCAISSGNIAVIDHSKDGILIENNFINTVNGVQSDSAYTSVSYNTINVTDTAIAFNDGGLHLLASLNVINGAGKHAVVNNAKNVVFIKNKLGSIEANSVHLMTVAMNEFTKPEKNVTLTDCQYVLVDDNTGISLDKKTGCTNVYGDDALDQTARVEYGVNEDLLPKLDKEFFVGMKRRDTVNYGGTEMTLNDYVDLMAVQSEYVIIPPGAYSLDTIHLTKVKNLSIYAYGVMAEYYSYKNPAMIAGNCDTVILKGITIDHADIANAQGTVVDKTDKYLVWKSDEGYLADLTDMNYFPEQAWGARFLKGSDIPCADIDFQKKEKDSDGNIRLYYGNGNSRNVLVGDKIVMRGLMQQISDVWSSSNMQYEDVSIYNGTKFAFSERGNGEKATRMNRVAVTPGPAPILKDQNGNFRTNADGSYVRGVPRMASTADATHSTNMQKGPITTNSVFEKMTDDGTNINGEFSKVTNYDPETNTLTYKYGDNAYSGICANFKVGDKVLIFTRRGKLLIDTVATSETSMTPDYVYSVQLKDDVVLENGSLLQNASASGNDFVFDNCKVDNVRSRGLLIKASKGIIKNCTLTNTGMSGILVKPEIDEPWNECGYADGLIIENNFLKNNGILTGSDLHSPINITGDGQNKSDPLYQMHKNISVKNNKIEDRNTQYAIHVNSLQASEIKNNDLGTRKGYTMQTDTNPGIYLNGDSSIVVSNNIYPEKADPKVETSNTAKDITGNDVGSLIASMLETKVESVLVNNQWKIQVVMKNLTTHPISGVIAIDKATVGMVNLKDTITINKLAANETITKYIDIICPPSQLNPRQGVGNIALKVKLDDGTVGKITTKLSFDIAVKAENAPVITGTTIDPVWEKAPKTYLGKENADPSAEIKFLWDQEYLYFYTSVQDAEHYQASCADMMWMNDCVQLAIDPSRSIESGINGQAELGFALNSQTNKVMAYAWINTISGKTGILNITTDVEANVFRDEAHKNTVYQAKIPWSMIGADGKCPELNKEIGFNVALTDYDKSVELTTSIQLYGGTQGSKDPGLFGAMRLFETAPNPPVGPTPLPDVKPTPEPVQPPTVTQSVDDKGTIKLQIEAPDISEVVTTLDKTIVKNEVTIDETIIAKATEKTPITIDMKLSTENTKKVIENSLTQKVEIKLVVPNALFSNQYVSISSLTISKEVFEQAKISKKNVAFIVETIDGTIIAAFAFEGAEIAHIVDTNLAVNLFPAHKDKAGVNKNGVTLSFVHSGKLPSKATVTLNVSKYYPNGTELFLYYENKETGKMDFVASGIKVVEGKALIGIEHCSNYMITDTAIATDVPKTADTTTIYFTIAFSFLMLAACLGFIRRTILNKEFSHQ